MQTLNNYLNQSKTEDPHTTIKFHCIQQLNMSERVSLFGWQNGGKQTVIANPKGVHLFQQGISLVSGPTNLWSHHSY